MKIPISFYQTSDVVTLAKILIGKHLFTNIAGNITSGMITETEAYAGVTDRASHAYGEKRTERTKIMYHAGGVSYVYLCYGVYYLFNVVSGKENEPHAILIRGVIPTHGFEFIKERTRQVEISYKISNGPGKLTKALGINKEHDGLNLDGNKVWIEDLGTIIKSEEILITERIGVQYAGADAKLPYRFLLKTDFYL